MALATYTDQQKSDARLGGFRRSKPKSPKGKITDSKFANYERRWNDYVRALKQAATKGSAKRKTKDDQHKRRAQITKARH